MTLAPQICGLWDGCHLWAQWNAVEGATYLFEWRVRGGEWRVVQREGGLQRHWLVLATWMQGAEVEVRVAMVNVETDSEGRLLGAEHRTSNIEHPTSNGEPAWEVAQEVTFRRSRCAFRISSSSREIFWKSGQEFASVVEGGACVYRLTEDVAFAAGGSVEVEVEAVGVSGYNQLDQAGDFRVEPALGVVIENIAPSVADVEGTGRDFTVIAGVEMKEFRMVITRGDVR